MSSLIKNKESLLSGHFDEELSYKSHSAIGTAEVL